jgi:hypothetical protein
MSMLSVAIQKEKKHFCLQDAYDLASETDRACTESPSTLNIYTSMRLED